MAGDQDNNRNDSPSGEPQNILNREDLRRSRLQAEGGSSGSGGKKAASEADEVAAAARRRRQAARRRNRRENLRRRIMIAGAAAAVVVIVLIALVIHGHKGGRRKDSGNSLTDVTETIDHNGSDVLHLSFPRLLVETAGGNAAGNAAGNEAGNEDGTSADADTESAKNGPQSQTPYSVSSITVDDFNRILNDLYEKGYMLVDLTTLVERDDDGVYHDKDITLPGGKKPLILSERDVRYTGVDSGDGYAASIRLAEDGHLINQYSESGKAVQSGVFDLITCIEAFVEAHPDFSYNNARGILALTGADGVLGYENGEDENCQAVINRLFELGWKFASNSYSGISYGVSQELFEQDAEKWQETVVPGVGLTEIIILPGRADIGSRSPYTEDNEKYHLLQEQGFRYFCVDDSSNQTWMQTGKGYVRQGMHEVNSLEQYTALIENGLDSFVRVREAEDKKAAMGIQSQSSDDIQESDSTDGSDEEEASYGADDTDSEDASDYDEEYDGSDYDYDYDSEDSEESEYTYDKSYDSGDADDTEDKEDKEGTKDTEDTEEYDNDENYNGIVEETPI